MSPSECYTVHAKRVFYRCEVHNTCLRAHLGQNADVSPPLVLFYSRWGQARRQSAPPSAKPWLRSRSRLLLRTGCRWLRFWTECLGAQAAVLLMDKTKLVRSDFALPCQVLVSMDSQPQLCAWALASIGDIAEYGEPTGCQWQTEMLSEHEKEMPRPVLHALQAGWQVAGVCIACLSLCT